MADEKAQDPPTEAFLDKVRERAGGALDIRHTLVLAGDIHNATPEMRKAARQAYELEVAKAVIALRKEEKEAKKNKEADG